MLLCTLLCGCGSSVPAIQGENFVYVSGETYFLRSPSGERDLGIKSDGNHRLIHEFYTDTTLTGMVCNNVSKGGLEVYPVYFDGDLINPTEVKDINIGEATILSDGGGAVALTDHGLYYENDEGELWFTDFYTKTPVCKFFRQDSAVEFYIVMMLFCWIQGNHIRL